MYDIRQFRPVLYVLVILGITGFAMATAAPGLWLLSMLLIGFNALLVRSGRFRPIPRWLANVVTMAALSYVALNIRGHDTILVLGQFLVVLQLIKLFEQRVNRDLGQLIVLSLLLIVAAAISTTSLAFGLLLFVYLVLSLYCCLLFHLKTETDTAKAAMGLRENHPADLARLRQDQRRLGSSMRRLTLVVAAAAVTCGVVVFLLFPRGAGASFLGGPRFKSSEAVTGFSGEVSFQQIARITQNPVPVAYIELLRDGRPVEGGQTLYLRGNTLDLYVSDPTAADRWTWKTTPQAEHRIEPRGGNELLGRSIEAPPSILEQRVELEPVGLDVLPALAGAFMLRSDDPRWMRHSLADGTISLTGQPVRDRYSYTVWSSGQLGFHDDVNSEAFTWLKLMRDRIELLRLDTLGEIDLSEMNFAERGREIVERFGMTPPPFRMGRWGVSDAEALSQMETWIHQTAPFPMPEEVKRFALDPEVSGTDAEGNSLAERRIRTPGTTPFDERIARNITRHLQTQYGYTLDVTDARLSADQDPLAWFVSEDGRMGHCEYFAGTLAAACQALGIPARVVVGFKSDEFNPTMQRYVVRQSDAHAWVEVLTERGWISLDPTSGNNLDLVGDTAGILQQMRQWLEFLEYTWANNVVAYDNDRQENLIQNFETNLAGGETGVTPWQRFQDWLEQQNLYFYSAKLMAWLIVAALAAAALFVGAFLFEKWRLRRRARRIGLADLPPEQARRLARELAFYDELMRMLYREGIERGPSQTPREFARSLSFLPREAFETILGLTEIFYRVRYGNGRLTSRRRRWLGRTLERLNMQLERA